MPWDCFPKGQLRDSPSGDVEKAQKVDTPDSSTADFSELNSPFG